MKYKQCSVATTVIKKANKDCRNKDCRNKDCRNNDCRDCSYTGSSVISLLMKALTSFHLLLFGVTITTIIKVGNAVAFSLSLVSAIRAKLDARYLQRQTSYSKTNQCLHQPGTTSPCRMGLASLPVSLPRQRTANRASLVTNRSGA